MPNEIKISANLDTASFRTVDNAIKSLITTVDNLNRSMGRLGESFSKIKGSSPGQGSASTIKTQGTKQGGILPTILGNQDGSSINTMLSATNQAFDTVSRKIKAFTDEAVANMGRINTSVKGMGAGGGWGNAGIGRSGTGGLGGGTLAGVSANTVPTMPEPGRSTGGKGGFLNSLMGGGTSAQQAQNLTNIMAQAASGNISGALGGLLTTPLGAAGAIGAGAYAGYKVGVGLTDTAQNLYSENLDWTLNRPVLEAQSRARMAAPLNKMFHAGMSRSYSHMMSWDKVFQNKQFMNTFRDIQMNKETVGALMEDMSFTGIMKDFKGKAGLKVGQTMQDFLANPDFRSIPSEKMEDLRTIMRTKMMNQVPAEMASRMSSMEEATYESMNPMTKMMVDEIGQNALGRVKFMRAAGLGTGTIKRKGRPNVTAVEDILARNIAGGWDQGDIVAQHQSLLGIGAGYAKAGHNRNFLVSAGAAGLSNAGELIKTGGTIGGSVGAADSFFNHVVQGTGGRGGLDVAVTRDLFSGIGRNALATGMYGSENLNWVGGAGATMVYGGGQDVGGQQNSLQRYFLGGQAEAAYTSGSRSSFDRVVANEASMAATGGFGASSKALMRMSKDPRLLASIAGGGAVPEWAEGLVTKESAGSFLDRTRRARFANVVDSTFGTDPLRSGLLKDLRSMNNDSNLVLRDRMESTGLKKGSKEWFAKERKLTMNMGSILEGENPLADAGLLEESFLRSMGLTTPKGKGHWAASPKGAEAAALKQEKENLEAKGEAGATAPVQKGVKDARPTAFAKTAVEGITDVRGAINDFGQAAVALTNALNRIVDTVGSSGAKAIRAEGPGGKSNPATPEGFNGSIDIYNSEQ